VDTPVWPKQFLPFEQHVLSATWRLLNEKGRALFVEQVKRINKIQRPLDWREINFYSMHWFKLKKWPEEVLFRERDEFELGTVLLRTEKHRVKVTVWSVGGRLFQLHSPSAMKPLRTEAKIVVENAYAGHHQYKAAI
jgi:hypothetical protein